MTKWDFQITHGNSIEHIAKINEEKYSDALKFFLKKHGQECLEKMKKTQKQAKIVTPKPLITIDIGIDYEKVQIGRTIYRTKGTSLKQLLKEIPLPKLEKELNNLIKKGPDNDERRIISRVPTILASSFNEITKKQLKELLK